MSDEKFIHLFRTGKHNKAFRKLYQYFSKVEKFVLNHGGTKSEAKDLFQDALLVVYEKFSDPKFELQCTTETYLFSICKYKWKNRLTKKHSSKVLELNPQHWLVPEYIETNEEEFATQLLQAKEAIRILGDQC